jgi:hypothetical protein
MQGFCGYLRNSLDTSLKLNKKKLGIPYDASYFKCFDSCSEACKPFKLLNILLVFLSIPENHFYRYIMKLWAGIAQSVLRLATDWTVLGSNPGVC